MKHARLGPKGVIRQPFGQLAAALALIGLIVLTAEPAPAAPPPTPSQSPKALPDGDLLHQWQPLHPLPGATRERVELRPLARSHRKGRWSGLCKGAERLRVGLMRKAAKLFYGPVRQGADTRAIDRFLKRYVRGARPLLITAGEVFAPAPALRDLAVDGCVRAGQPAVAERFVAQAALAGKESKLRVALALIRMQKGAALRDQLWLVGDKGGGARAAMLRALASSGGQRVAHLAAAERSATAEERALIAQFKRWLAARR